MAQTYENTPVLSQIKIGTTNYYLKDADARAVLDGFNDTICKGAVGTVSDNNDSFVTAKNIKAYVDQIAAAGIVLEVVTELPTAAAGTMGKIYLVKHTHATSDTYDEYITVRSGTSPSYTYAWEKIGNTDIDLSAYVTDVSVATGGSSGPILKVTKNGVTSDAFTFSKFANSPSAAGSLSTVDSGAVTYTPKGTITKVTSGGTQIGGSVSSVTVIDGKGSLPAHGADKFTANTPTSLDTTKFSGGTLSGGSVTFPTITSKPTATCATSGVTATVSGEVLTLAAAGTATVVTSGLTLGSGSYTAPTLTPAKLLDGFYTAGTAASFTQGTFSQGSLPTTKTVTPTFTGNAYAFAGTEETADVDLVKSTKNISVTPSSVV